MSTHTPIITRVQPLEFVVARDPYAWRNDPELPYAFGRSYDKIAGGDDWPQFKAWLGELVGECYPLHVWRELYDNFHRDMDERAERSTMAEALW